MRSALSAKGILFSLFLALIPMRVGADTPPFALATNAFSGSPPSTGNSIAWGDFNRDGRMDLLFGSGITPPAFWASPPAWLEVNSGTVNGFTNRIPSSEAYYAIWLDADSDGFLDILWDSGSVNTPSSPALDRNLGNGSFVTIQTSSVHSNATSLAVADYDADGRADVLASSFTGGASSFYVELWHNAGSGYFSATPIPGFPTNVQGVATWIDYDGDGWPDLFFVGVDSTFANEVIQMWRNTGGTFTNVSLPGLTNLFLSTQFSFIDYDGDGRLDILTATRQGVLLFRNTGNGFTNVPMPGLPTNAIYNGCISCADYDGDGRPDFLLMAVTNNYQLTGGGFLGYCRLYRNTGTDFTNVPVTGLPQNVGILGTIAFGDADGDGRPDFVFGGRTNSNGGYIVPQLWTNNTPAQNAPPSAPSGLSNAAAGPFIVLSWNPATDDHTPPAALTYNVRIGTSPGASDVMSPLSLPTGRRLVFERGNAGARLSKFFRADGNRTYYWSVQAIDSANVGGPFSVEQQFGTATVLTPPNGAPVPGDMNGDGIVSQSEFSAVLANLNGNGIVSQSELGLVLSSYFPYSPWLDMTNVAGLGGTNVTFALTNSFVGSFDVQYSTDLTNWFPLGPATPRYLFTDTNAPANPKRFYRLVYP